MINTKTWLLLMADLLLVILSLTVAYLFRFDFNLLHKINLAHSYRILGVSLAVYTSMFFFFKIHRIIWRHASLNEMLRLLVSVSAGFFVIEIMTLAYLGLHYLPLSILPLQALFYAGLLLTSRVIYRLYRHGLGGKTISQRVLIVGAGQAAEGIIRDMQQHTERGYIAIGILDDDNSLHHRTLHGVRVLGATCLVESILTKMSPDLVVFAIPSIINNNLLNRVYDACDLKNIPLRVLPGLAHLAQGRVNIDALKKVDIEDLLGREPVSIFNQELSLCLKDKIVLVTGAGGSIGYELCHQIAMNKPKALSIIDNSEFNLFSCHSALIKQFPDLLITLSLTDVSRYEEVDLWLNNIKPDVIFHAAAFKHVPMLEEQLFMAVKNNVLASQLLADLADKHQVQTFVLVSSDKAVNPTNVMGMTKRLAEIYCQTKNNNSQTNFVTVRFGNVLGSNGSVLPLFRKQLADGGPITVTHPDMTRYFMMIPEAVTLILQSFMLGKGGEIFVLEMGEPIKIIDLAEKLITLSGQKPYKQINIQFTGVRPGEKLFEEIFHDKENLFKTNNKKILSAQCRQYKAEQIQAAYQRMQEHYSSRSYDQLLHDMQLLVPEYQRPGSFTKTASENVPEKMLA